MEVAGSGVIYIIAEICIIPKCFSNLLHGEAFTILVFFVIYCFKILKTSVIVFVSDFILKILRAMSGGE